MKVYDYCDNFVKTKDIISNLIYGEIDDKLDFTISIPLYGCNVYFEELLKQLKFFSTKFNFQIILSDGKVYEDEENDIVVLLKKYNIKNIAYFIPSNRLTQYNNFNRCINLAHSKYVSMIHDDDLFVDNYIEIAFKAIEYMNKNKKIGMIQGNFPYVYSKKEIYNPKHNDVQIYKINPYIISLTGKSQTAIPSCGVLFRKEAFIKSGGYNDKYFASGDSFLSVTMMKQGYDIYKFKNLTGFYRVSINSSLKVEMCRAFSVQEFNFVNDWKKENIFRNIWLSFMNNYIYSRNIDSHCELFSNLNTEITTDNLDYRKKYKKYRKYGLYNVIFKIVYKLFFRFKYVKI